MKYLILLLSSLFILREAVGPPVTTKKPEEENEIPAGEDWGRDIEYERYLKEVVQALESDPTFKDKLEKAQAVDIRSGKIAQELEYVNHHVRTKLDELKRQELERLRHLAVMQYEQDQLRKQEHGEADSTGGGHRSGERQKLHIAPHLDHKNPHTFEVEDLRKLIVQTGKELEEADRKRREEFKQYELQKEYEKQERLRAAKDDAERKNIKNEFETWDEQHKKHPQLHHPGSKQQLEEVWQEQDHMNPEDFNPKTFFHLHDLDGNGVWDADEVKMLFKKELDKMYDPENMEDDPKERLEEMERMREHVFNESDTNHDRLISYDEFLAQTKKTEYEQDPGWEGLDQTPAYTKEEYEAFEHQRQEEVRRLVEQGYIPPQPVYSRIEDMAPGYHGQVQHLNQPPQVYHPGQVQYHHPMASNHIPQQQQHPGQGYPNAAGPHGAYKNQQPVHYQGYPPDHPQVAHHQGYAQHPPQGVPQHPQMQGQPPHGAGGHPQQVMNQHQQAAIQQQQAALHQQQQAAHQQQQAALHQQQQAALHQQQQAVLHQQQAAHQQQQSALHQQQQAALHQQQQAGTQSQPSSQQQVPGGQKVDNPHIAQHQQGQVKNEHHENLPPSDPNAVPIPQSQDSNANPSSSVKSQNLPEVPHTLEAKEKVDHQNKIPPPQ